MYVICNLRDHRVFCGYKYRGAKMVPEITDVMPANNFSPMIFKHFSDATDAKASLPGDLSVISLYTFVMFYKDCR